MGRDADHAWTISVVIDLDHEMVYFLQMRISVTDAKGQLTDLVRRAEAGDEVILTRHGQPAVRLTPIRTSPAPGARRQILEAARASGVARANAGLGAARSQDFLYDDDGMPK